MNRSVVGLATTASVPTANLFGKPAAEIAQVWLNAIARTADGLGVPTGTIQLIGLPRDDHYIEGYGRVIARVRDSLSGTDMTLFCINARPGEYECVFCVLADQVRVDPSVFVPVSE